MASVELDANYGRQWQSCFRGVLSLAVEYHESAISKPIGVAVILILLIPRSRPTFSSHSSPSLCHLPNVLSSALASMLPYLSY